ncbi:hypothetical protein [Streptomyces rimosus]|uniref:hypothetical protein n=1 Tax=Streptomyces rimosus TaxID=1927 RepID=UPI0004C99FAC|nr:hypothetical protein [Streptomyces rimosus]
MTWQPRRLEPKPRRKQRTNTEDELNPLRAVQEQLWEQPEPEPVKKEKPVEEWKANDLVNYWSRCISRARWADHLIGHTNRGGLGKTFREALDAGHSPAALKASIDTFFGTPRYHAATRPWTLYRSVINELLPKAPTQSPDPWGGAQQTEVPREITDNWAGYTKKPADPWAAAANR